MNTEDRKDMKFSTMRGVDVDGPTMIKKQLNVTDQQLDWYAQWMDVITDAHLPEGENISQEDFDLQLLHMHSLNCYDESFSRITMHTNAATAPVTKCLQHPTKNASWICVNSNCPLQLFCTKCNSNHNKVCSRSRLLMTVESVKHGGEYDSDDDLSDESASESEIVNEIDELGMEMKDRFNRYVDLLVLQWKNRLKTMSKKSLHEYSKKCISVRKRDYEGRFCLQ